MARIALVAGLRDARETHRIAVARGLIETREQLQNLVDLETAEMAARVARKDAAKAKAKAKAKANPSEFYTEVIADPVKFAARQAKRNRKAAKAAAKAAGILLAARQAKRNRKAAKAAAKAAGILPARPITQFSSAELEAECEVPGTARDELLRRAGNGSTYAMKALERVYARLQAAKKVA